jgi:hypothetical protein
MPVATKLIKISKDNQPREEAMISYTEVPPWRLEMHIPAHEAIVEEGPDLFECLMRARMRLEPEGYQLLCNGSRKDCWASGMSRDMGGGAKLYVLMPGKRVSKDLGFIFDEAPAERISTVKAQKEFYEQWLRGEI